MLGKVVQVLRVFSTHVELDLSLLFSYHSHMGLLHFCGAKSSSDDVLTQKHQYSPCLWSLIFAVKVNHKCLKAFSTYVELNRKSCSLKLQLNFFGFFRIFFCFFWYIFFTLQKFFSSNFFTKI